MTNILTFKAAKAYVEALGLKLKDNYDWSEYIVIVPWNRKADYYTDDLLDACNTANKIAASKPNP
jgi:hypothetical protein